VLHDQDNIPSSTKIFLTWVHDAITSSDRPPQDIVGTDKVDDNNLVLFINLFSHAYEVVRPER
jgi:hypothetical protein